MLHLQEKAHYSLDEFRKGKGSPLGRYSSMSEPPTPDDENDELSILGGKTRLVAKKEPSSPSPQILDRSPTSMNPVIPFALSPSTESNIDPNAIAYLESFSRTVPHQQHQIPTPVSAHASYSEDLSPASMFGMSTFPTSTFHSEPLNYISNSQSQNMLSQNHQNSSPTHQQSHQPQTGIFNSLPSGSFPQYFPVYDYGSGAMSNGVSTPMLDAHPNPGHRRGSGSPEATMDTMWHDFVASAM